MGTTVAKKLPNNLINADHYHGGESKFSVYAKVPAPFKLITGYPWWVLSRRSARKGGRLKILP